VEQVDFYVLENTQQDADVKFACRVTDKAFAQGLKIHIHTGSPEQAQSLDKALWTFRQDSFLPHALAGSAQAPQCPIIIGDRCPDEINADVLINLAHDTQDWFSGFKRVADIVPGNENSKLAGRNRFRWYREQGQTPRTHTI